MSALDRYRETWPHGEISKLADEAIDELEGMLREAYRRPGEHTERLNMGYFVWRDWLRRRWEQRKERALA